MQAGATDKHDSQTRGAVLRFCLALPRLRYIAAQELWQSRECKTYWWSQKPRGVCGGHTSAGHTSGAVELMPPPLFSPCRIVR